MRMSALEGHRLWAPGYDSTLNPVLALETRMLKQLLCPIASTCFIDVACGTGRWMTYVRQQGAKVFGIDFCTEMLTEAEKKPELSGRSALAEASRLPIRARVADIVLCSFAAGYFPYLNRAVAEMARILKPQGKLIISDLHPVAVSAGWTRSFRRDDLVVEMEHYHPSIDEFQSASEGAGLQLRIQIESGFGDPERSLFITAGKEQNFENVSAIPAVWIGVWDKR